MDNEPKINFKNLGKKVDVEFNPIEAIEKKENMEMPEMMKQDLKKMEMVASRKWLK